MTKRTDFRRSDRAKAVGARIVKSCHGAHPLNVKKPIKLPKMGGRAGDINERAASSTRSRNVQVTLPRISILERKQ